MQLFTSRNKLFKHIAQEGHGGDEAKPQAAAVGEKRKADDDGQSTVAQRDLDLFLLTERVAV